MDYLEEVKCIIESIFMNRERTEKTLHDVVTQHTEMADDAVFSDELI